MVVFPPLFYFVFDISNLLSYIQNNELARPIMGTIFLVYIYIRDSQLNRPESVSLDSLARQLYIVRAIFFLITRKEGGA